MNERCFAMRRGGKCNALNVSQCANYASCPFYKPMWKANRDAARLNQKLCAMSTVEQQCIADKYYGGKMLWRSEI